MCFSKGGNHPGPWVLNLRQILWFRNKGDPLEQGWGVWYWESLLGALSLHYHFRVALPCPPFLRRWTLDGCQVNDIAGGHLSPVARFKTRIIVHGFLGASWLAHMRAFLQKALGYFFGETSMSLKQAF